LTTQRAGGRDIELADALAALPRRQREAVAYHYVAGLPYQDVAAITGGSTDAARRAAADGIARLRKTYPGTALPDGENP
jgi:DNA-directed RNA polymerase specialized sigma24 family protein